MGRPSVTSPPRLRHLKALDGIRGLAIVAVLVDHAGASLPGGFLGVDMFFVLSGYLVTGLLLVEYGSGRARLGEFWARRARRLLPALVPVLVVVAAFARASPDAATRASVAKDIAAAAGYVSNWRFIAAGEGYFAQFTAPSPLRHFWSLAVEEQFYLVWPLILIVLLQVAREPRARAAILLSAAFGSAVWMAHVADVTSFDRAYYGTDTRAQALLVGAALAVVMIDVSGRHRRLARSTTLARIGLGGLSVLVVLLFSAHGDAWYLYHGGFLVAALATATLIAAAPGGRNPVTLITDRPALRFLGGISYGTYLWHWPLVLFLTTPRTGLSGAPLILLRIGASIAFGWASAVIVERPVQRSAFFAGRRGLVLVPAVIAVAGAFAALAVFAVPTEQGITTDAARAAAEAGRRAAQSRTTTTEGTATGSATTAPALGTPPENIMLVGDSVAKTIGMGFSNAADEMDRVVYNHGELGCGLIEHGAVRRGGLWGRVPPECKTLARRWKAVADAEQPDVVVALFDVWSVLDARIDGIEYTAGTPAHDQVLEAGLDRLLGPLAEDKHPVVLLTAPYNNRGGTYPTQSWEEDDPARVDHYNRLLRAYAKRNGHAVVDLNAFAATDGEYTNSVSNVRLRYDGVHFTPDGGELAFRWLAPQLPQTPARN